MKRWAEHFREQSNWSVATVSPPVYVSEWNNPSRSQAFIRNGVSRPVLTSELTKLLGSVWPRESIPKNWCENVTVSIYKKHDKSSCDNHRWISLASIISERLTGIIPCGLSSIRERCLRENQGGSRLDHGCIDQTFTSRQILAHNTQLR